MVARGQKTGPLANRLTREVLRIRQPASTRPVLYRLEMDQPAAVEVHPIQGSNTEFP